jgi:hypothetical protein
MLLDHPRNHDDHANEYVNYTDSATRGPHRYLAMSMARQKI